MSNFIKMVGLVMSWPVIVSKLCITTSNICRKTVKIVEKGLNFYANKNTLKPLEEKHRLFAPTHK